MKFNNLKYLSIIFCCLVAFSCGDDEYTEITDYGANTLEASDALFHINTPVIAFQAGTESYDISMSLLNGLKKINKLNMYSVFNDGVSGSSSNEVLIKSFDVGSDLRTSYDHNFNYADLKNGLTVDGAALPDDEVAVAIGSGWVFRFEGEIDGGTIPLPGSINVAVLSRFAGLYEVIESDYYRINEQSGIADWTGQTRFIGSVDETTFSYNDWWGPFQWDNNSFNFVVDFDNDNKITVPIITGSGLFSGNRALDCSVEADQFVDVPCDGSNVLEANDATGKHVIKITYGYFTDGSGSRQFYEVLRKL